MPNARLRMTAQDITEGNFADEIEEAMRALLEVFGQNAYASKDEAAGKITRAYNTLMNGPDGFTRASLMELIGAALFAAASSDAYEENGDKPILE